MQRLHAMYLHLLDEVSLDFTRYLYSQINWDNRLILILLIFLSISKIILQNNFKMIFTFIESSIS